MRNSTLMASQMTEVQQCASVFLLDAVERVNREIREVREFREFREFNEFRVSRECLL